MGPWCLSSCVLTIRIIRLSFHVIVARSEVELKSHAVVADGQVELTNAIVTASSVEVCVCILRIDLNHAAEVLHCLLVPSQTLVGDAAIVQGVDVRLVLLDHGSVVNDGFLVAAELGEAVGSVVEGLYVV